MPMRVLTLLAWLLAAWPAAVLAQNPSQPLTMRVLDISWPLANGAVVPQGATAVMLERGMGFQVRFRLPADCAALDEAVTQYGDDGTVAFQHERDSAREYCGRARVLTLGTPTARRDFVSRADFTSLSLDLVPYDLRCRGVVSDSWRALCERIRAGDASVCSTGSLPPQVSYARLLTQVDAATSRVTLACRPVRVDAVTCRLAKSSFTGSMTVSGDVVRCTQQPSATPGALGLRLTDVTFRDVNSDGLMDALLTVVDAGAAASAPPAWLTFVLTKRSAAAPLERVLLP